MMLLSPFGLLALASLPVLIWLWRLASTQRRVDIPSLVPFEHLLRRAPTRRSRLVVNLLFWLQAAALLAMVLALARPVLWRRRARTTLVILDTSASMGARARGSSAFDRARRRVLAELARKRPTEQYFIMTTAPLGALTPQPTSDGVAAMQAVEALRPSHLGGNLAATARIGRSLLAEPSDELLVVTDEPQPPGGAGGSVRWAGVGEPLPNVGFVGLDAQGPLCAPAEARVVATVQNFSDADSPVTLTATQAGRRVAQLEATLPPGGRQPLSLALPPELSGWIALDLAAPRDALEADNRAWVQVRSAAGRPLLVRTHSDAFAATISRWLQACPALSWRVQTDADPGEPPADALVITDQAADVGQASAALLFVPPARPTPVLSAWVAVPDHPIGAYLAPVELVAAALETSAGPAVAGHPVISGLLDGRKLPVVVADEREGRRRVTMLVDPATGRDSTPLVLVFFNSLRWLLGSASAETTGVPIALAGFRPGRVTVHRPDGTSDVVELQGGTLHYQATTLAGRYRAVQGTVTREFAANLVDPLESNLMDRASTWRSLDPAGSGTGLPKRAAHPLTHLLVLGALLLLLGEWWRYSLKGARAP